MMHEDFYTGEPDITGSPLNFTNENIINTGGDAVLEAANMASFGKYDYSAGARQSNFTAPVAPFNGGGFGGNFNPYQQQGFQGGIGAPPPQYWGNPQPTYNYYRPYGQYQQPYQQPQYQQQTTYHIPGINISGEYMPDVNFESQITEMELEYFNRQQETDAKQIVDRQGSVYGGYNNGYGMNYYGMPYYNPYQYNSLNNEFQSRVNKMKDDARQRRLDYNLNLSRLAHNFAGDIISDDEIRERYTGKTVDIPEAYVQTQDQYYENNRFNNLKPFDNSQMYRDHRAQIQREYNKIIPADADLKTTFDRMAIIWADWEMEEEMHRRKNAGNLYNSGDNSYKYYIRKCAAERYAREKGLDNLPSIPGYSNINNFDGNAIKQNYISNNPVLSKVATLSDDGTMNVSFSLPSNVGSNKGEVYTVHNQNEAEYDNKRDQFYSKANAERFDKFLAAEPGNAYLDELKRKKQEEYRRNGQI